MREIMSVSQLSELIESLNKDTQDSRSRFQLQIIYSYKRIQELRKTIEECDSTLIREIMAAEERQANQVQSQATLRVVGEVVNIRAEPSLDSEVIRQVSSDTIVQPDTKMLAELSDSQRLAITAGEGWYPIILPDGEKGYISSLYVSNSP